MSVARAAADPDRAAVIAHRRVALLSIERFAARELQDQLGCLPDILQALFRNKPPPIRNR